jgi:uncharacterized metal-binding protein YceD (DUF177 family)
MAGRTRVSRPHPKVQPWTFAVAVTDVPETGRRVELVADQATRAAIANLAGVLAVPRLAAQFDLARHGRDGLHVVGRVAATVEQNCVVTLEPVRTDIDEPVNLVFIPAQGQPADRGVSEQIHALDEDEPPQTLDNGSVDLGALAMEFLLLGIDPYPRKAGAVFDVLPVDDPQARPFAALAALKRNPGGNSA